MAFIYLELVREIGTSAAVPVEACGRCALVWLLTRVFNSGLGRCNCGLRLNGAGAWSIRATSTAPFSTTTRLNRSVYGQRRGVPEVHVQEEWFSEWMDGPLLAAGGARRPGNRGHLLYLRGTPFFELPAIVVSGWRLANVSSWLQVGDVDAVHVEWILTEII